MLDWIVVQVKQITVMGGCQKREELSRIVTRLRGSRNLDCGIVRFALPAC